MLFLILFYLQLILYLAILTSGYMNKFLILVLATAITAAGCTKKQAPATPETALEKYLGNNDKTFSWEVKETFEAGDLKASVLKLTSQQWREHTWVHQLTVVVPEKIKHECALLFITGGSVKDGEPRWKGKDDNLLGMLSVIAERNSAVVAVISQVPNQPLYDNLTEDALISFTLHNYRKDKDLTWPLLFPMVKSAVKAMDAVTDYCRKEYGGRISRFILSGASKRGWTTWLTASQDKRVVAIAPMVIDVLNMPVNIAYQKEVWGDYSEEIEDYVKLGIAQDLSTPDGKELVAMIDPYSYREKLTIPKMIFIGTNDPYWPVDAIKNYINEMPGENYIHYVANAGHDLGDGRQAINALNAFFGTVIKGLPQPACGWEIEADTLSALLSVKASSQLKDVFLWVCDSPDRDFRNDTFRIKKIEYEDASNIRIKVKFPDTGYRAFYTDLVYPSPVSGEYTKSTRMFVCGRRELYLY